MFGFTKTDSECFRDIRKCASNNTWGISEVIGKRKSPVKILKPSSASVRNERSCCLLSCMIFAIISCVYISSDFSNSLSILLETQMVSAYSASLYSRDLNYYYFLIGIRS